MSEPSVLAVLVTEVTATVRAFALKFPAWLQPVALVCATVLACVLTICLTPVLLVLGLSGVGRTHRSTMKRLYADLRRIWVDRSPAAATRRLREIVDQLEWSEVKSVRVEPYGWLRSGPAKVELQLFLYENEIARKDWGGALSVAEEMVERLLPEDAAPWQRSRARCLIELGRRAEALEILLAIRNPSVREPEVDDLLDRARSAS